MRHATGWRPRARDSGEHGLSRRTLNLILSCPAKSHQIGWDDRVGSLRRDAEAPQDASLGFRLRGDDVVRRQEIDLIASRRQQFRKKPECYLRGELTRGCDPTRRTERRFDQE